MKKLFLLLLVIPSMSFAQTTYNTFKPLGGLDNTTVVPGTSSSGSETIGSIASKANGAVQSQGGTCTSCTLTNGTANGTVISTSLATPVGATVNRTISSKLGEGLSVMDFGAVCDGKTDDTAAFNNAIIAAADQDLGAGGTVLHKVIIPGRECLITGTVNLLTGVWLQGTGETGTELDFTENSQILFKNNSVNRPWSGSKLSDFYIYINSADSNQKFPIDMATNQPANSTVDSVQIENGTYYGIDIAGNNDTINNVMMQGVKGIGIRVGQGMTKGDNTDPKILNTTIAGDCMANQSCTSSAILTYVVDAGGLTLMNDDMVGGYIGTKISPGAGQVVFHLFASNTVFSDSALGNGLLIDAPTSTSGIYNLNMSGSWSANSQKGDVLIENSGSGNVDGITITSGRFYSSNSDAMHFGTNVNNVTISDSSICGTNASYTNIYVENGDSGYNIHHNRMSKACDQSQTNAGTGISISGSNNKIIISDNDLSDISYPINVTPSTSFTMSAEIHNNLGANIMSNSIVSSSLITLPIQVSDNVTLSSTDGNSVQEIDGEWYGRTTLLYNSTTSSISFITGTNVCNSFTLASKSVAEITYTSNGCWYVH